jgi:hypothetical protein
MMQDGHVNLNTGFSWQNCLQQKEKSLHEQPRLKDKEETNKVLRLEYRFIYLSNFDTA